MCSLDIAVEQRTVKYIDNSSGEAYLNIKNFKGVLCAHVEVKGFLGSCSLENCLGILHAVCLADF